MGLLISKMKRPLSTGEAALELGVTHGRVRQLISQGRLPAEKIGGRLWVSWRDLKAVRRRKNGRPRAAHP